MVTFCNGLWWILWGCIVERVLLNTCSGSLFEERCERYLQGRIERLKDYVFGMVERDIVVVSLFRCSVDCNEGVFCLGVIFQSVSLKSKTYPHCTFFLFPATSLLLSLSFFHIFTYSAATETAP